MDKRDVTLERLSRQFEAVNRSEGKSPRTVTWYQHALELFMRFLEENSLSTKLGDINLELLREYSLYLQTRQRFTAITEGTGNQLKPGAVDVHLRALIAFFNWLQREGYTRESVASGFRRPKLPHQLIEPLNDNELAVIYSAVDSET